MNRKKTIEPSEQENDALCDMINSQMQASIYFNARSMNVHPLCYLLNTIVILANSLGNLDHAQTAKFLRALSVLEDPTSTKKQKDKAARKHCEAFEALMDSAALASAQPKGTA